MGWPTDAQIDQLAETLCRMAEVPGLDRGRAIFKGPDYRPVEWYSPHWGIGEFADSHLDLDRVHIPHGGSYDSRAELFEACRLAIEDALWARQDRIAYSLPQFFELLRERGIPKHGVQPDDLRDMAELLHGNVEGHEWLGRINEEWPPGAVNREGR